MSLNMIAVRTSLNIALTMPWIEITICTGEKPFTSPVPNLNKSYQNSKALNSIIYYIIMLSATTYSFTKKTDFSLIFGCFSRHGHLQ